MNESPVTQFLIRLNEFNAEHATEMWIPSLSRYVKFRPLMASHQRDMIKTLAGTNYFPSALAITMYEIVRDTCMEELDLTKLNTIDKTAITLQMRSSNIDDNIDLEFDQDTTNRLHVLNGGNPYTHAIKIKQHIESCKANLSIPKEITVKVPGASVTLRLPTMLAEYRFQQEIYTLSKATQTDQQLPISKEAILAAVYINTIAQYIKDVKIGDVEVKFDDATPNECAYITERLPSALTKKIREEISKFAIASDALTTVEFTFKRNKLKGTIPIDNTLFSS